MHLKSYFASTVESAMALAARDLGEDAMLVYSRPASPEAQYLGKYEVVFALPAGAPVRSTSGETRALDSSERELWQRTISSQIEDLGDKLDTMIEVAYALRANVPFQGSSSKNANSGSGSESSEYPPGAHTTGMAGSIATWNLVETVAVPGTTCMIVGPAGCGKTSLAVKIAAMMGEHAAVQPRIASLDVSRIGGGEWLRTCSALIGIPFSVLQTPQELACLLSSARPGAPLVIDTPPLDEFEPSLLATVEEALAKKDPVFVLLALPATWKASDLRRVVGRYSRLCPCAALLTRLDETDDCGPLFGEIALSRIPVALVSEGSRIPEDIRFAGVDELLAMMKRAIFFGQEKNEMTGLHGELSSRSAVAA